MIGKDEVASSNLASSSIKAPKPFGFGAFICDDARLEDLILILKKRFRFIKNQYQI